MIKLKNLWKIVSVIMAMSVMLIACDTESKDNEEKENDPMARFKTTPVLGKSESFTGGFKFTTEEGWECQYTSANASPSPVDKVYVRLNGDPAAIATIAKNKYVGDQFNDDSTKIFVDKDELEPEKLYTLTYDLKNGTVKLTEAADGAKATSTECQIADEEGKFPKGVYINGYLGKFWGGTYSPINDDNNKQYSLLMDVVSEEGEVYAFTWKAPAGTVTVTLKITMTEDTANDTAVESVLYLKDVPVKTDGTSEINGSIYGWPGDGGTPVTIKNEDGSRITGGIFDAAMTAKGNATWALTNYVNKNKDVNLSEKFRMEGADDVLQLLVDAEMWVPYVKGKVVTYSWKKAQNKLKAPDEEADKME